MPSFLKKLIYGKELSNPYVNPYHPGHISTGPPHPALPIPNPHAAHPTSSTLFTRPVSPTYLEEARRLAGRDPVTGRRVPAHQHPSGAQTGSHPEYANQQQQQQQPLQPYRSANEAFKPYPEAQGTVQWEPGRFYTGEVSANPYVKGGDAAMGRSVPVDTVNHAAVFVRDGRVEPRGTGGADWTQNPRADAVTRGLLQAENRTVPGRNGQLGESVYGTDGQAGTSRAGAGREERRKREEDRARVERQVGGYFQPERPVISEYYGRA